jgi:cation diffusion facilitator CzcD-associated flavoprotein CzcO
MIKGEIGLLQYERIERFTADGALLKDGSTVPADLLVLATGYYPQMGAGPPCARRGDGGAHRPGLGDRSGR